MEPTRLIALESSFNFRDLGGYVGAGGRPVRWRTLFRSDGLYRLTPADLTQLVGLRLRTVIDLRTASELEQLGRISWPDGSLAFHHLPLMDVLPPQDTYDQDWVDPARVARQYVAMLTSGSKAITSAIDVLCDPASYPLAYHCFVGKDRTGILSAVVLSALGVGHADIANDYALSEDAMRRMMAWLAANQPDVAKRYESSTAAIVAASPETMEHFLADLDDRYGGAEGYLRSLGRPDAGAQLRELLLES
ncbi:MAG: tyrosine-protein phosphatase [Acidimicrobiaceae bacterium]|nr:tyrosine-protein phosphatase [Acidimicrobiaceae bacterium]MBO0748317.1 tyrosine-protein phosphatase [Acidimicrobiaceae bacterium]